MNTNNNTLQLTELIIINSVEKFIDFYEKATGIEGSCDVEKVKALAKDENNIYYFDDNGMRTNNITRARYAWVDLHCRNHRGNPMFLSALKHFDEFEGHLVSDAQYLVGKSAEYAPSSSEFRKNGAKFIAKYEKAHVGSILEEDKIFIPVVSTPTTSIAPTENSAMIEFDEVAKEARAFLLVDRWETENGFRRFLMILGQRIRYYVQENLEDFYVKNGLGSVIVNTGLLTKYGKYLKVMYRLYLNTHTYHPYKIITDKVGYINNGFTATDASKELKPVEFKLGVWTPFSTNMDDYNDGYYNINHCVECRRDRFPDSVKDMPDINLAYKIQQELVTGINIHRCGGAYAKPIFKAKENEIHWMLPLHINASLNEAPELVMAISKKDGFFDVRTVLPYDSELRDKIRAMAPYADLW